MSGTKRSYSAGFNSLLKFCENNHLPALPVDGITLGAWLVFETSKPKPTHPKSLKKYLSGVRWHHLVNGHPWPFKGDDWLGLVKKSIAKKFPTKQFLKVPMSIKLLSLLCGGIEKWPYFSQMSFDDLVWACASVVMVQAALRGGEALTRTGSDRPTLAGRDVSLTRDGQPPGVIIRVRRPKTEPDKEFQLRRAMDGIWDDAQPTNRPSQLLAAYRARAAEMSIDVLGTNAAFKTADGKALSLAFMLKRANELKVRARVVVKDLDGNDIPFRAASWRAGFVLSARDAGVSEAQIRATGCWASDTGPAPYTFTSARAFSTASTAIAKSQAARPSSRVFEMGHLGSCMAVFEETQGWTDGR